MFCSIVGCRTEMMGFIERKGVLYPRCPKHVLLLTAEEVKSLIIPERKKKVKLPTPQ